MSTYREFLSHRDDAAADGFEPLWLPDFLFDFQRSLVEWAVRRGRAAIFADCGLGKTPMQLVWAENVARRTSGRVLVLTPLAVAPQTIHEAAKFGITAEHSRDGAASAPIVVTNYEQLHKFSSADFSGLVCDESSILKNYAGATRNQIISFAQRIPYRLLCTATPSPNDYTELGNSVEALGICRRVDMLTRYFVHDTSDTGEWRLKGHASDPFWRFVASWARADGFLFPTYAIRLDEQRRDRRMSISERCSAVAEIANAASGPFVAWCSLNAESALLAESISGGVELSGSDSDEDKERKLVDFAAGRIRALVTKPNIFAHGLNWQHCSRMSFFPSHSHEQFYQALRRCWRFGQKSAVEVHVVTTEAEATVMANLQRKERAASEMFAKITANMRRYYDHQATSYQPRQETRLPAWL